MTAKNDLMLPGLKPVLELLETDPKRIGHVYCKEDISEKISQKLTGLCKAHGIPLQFMSLERLKSLCPDLQAGNISHQGIMAALRGYNTVKLAKLLADAPQAPLPLVLALDQIQDPGNVGALCRTAWAMGCAGMIMPEHNSAPIGPAAARSSAGALPLMPVSIVPNLARALDEAEEQGFAIYGTGCQGNNCVNAFDAPWTLPAIVVIGNEKSGIRPGVAKRCQQMLHIPQLRQFDSLNAAQAGGILIAFCAARQLNLLR